MKDPDTMGGASPVPALPRRDRGEAEEVDLRGPLFSGPPRGTEVEQNTLGDCFFLASLASLAERRPEHVHAAIQARGGGKFAVRLFQKDAATGALAPHEVVVDARIPEEEGKAIYAATVNGRGIWVSLFEKAYAVLLGGYDHIDGGYASTAIEALTGRPARTTPLEHAHPDAIWDTLERAAAARQVTVTGTFTEAGARAMLQRRQGRGDEAAHGYDARAFTYTRHGLLEGHVYTLWSTSGAGPHRAVRLRNPWADFEPKGNGKDDGMFSMPFDAWMLLFADLTVGG